VLKSIKKRGSYSPK